MTHSLDLLFLSNKKAGALGPPIAHIYIKSSGRHDYAKDLDLITPQCVSIVEFEHEVARLKNELDDIAKRARRMFKEDAAR